VIGRQASLADVIPSLVPKRASRKRGITRERNWDRRPSIPSNAHCNAFSGDLTLDWQVTDGARTTMVLILQLAGGPGRELVTFTKSIATQRGLSPRAIRYHYAELEAAGWLERWHNRETNQVALRGRPRLHARPGASAVPEDRKKRLPAPWARPRQGRKPVSAINPVDSYPFALRGDGGTQIDRADALAAMAQRQKARDAEAAAERKRKLSADAAKLRAAAATTLGSGRLPRA
jgi:hypothetical protein